MEYKTRESIIINVLAKRVRQDKAIIAGLKDQLTKLQVALLEIKKEAFSAANDPHCYENEAFLDLCNMAGKALGHELVDVDRK